MPFTIPPATAVPLQPGFITDINNCYAAESAIAGINVLNSAYSGGADPSGVADSYAAIQAALTAASSATAPTVYVPAGTYIVSQALSIPGGVTVRGDGPSDSIIKMKNAVNQACVAASAGWAASTATTSINPIVLRDLTFDANQANQSSGAGHGVVLQSYYTLVQNCVFQNTRGDGLRFDQLGANGTTAISNTMVENRIRDCAFRANGANGFNVNDPTHNTITDGWIEDCAVQGSTLAGITIGSGAGWLVAGNHVYSIGGSAIAVNRMFQTRVTGNYIESCGASATSGFYFLIDAANGQVSDTGFGSVISANVGYFLGPAGNVGSTIGGIVVQSATGGTANVAITGNQLFCSGASGLPGIWLQNQSGTASVNAAVTGNVLNGWTTPVQLVANGGPMTINSQVYGPLDVTVAGAGLQVAEGSNAKQGTVTMNGTTAVVVSTTAVTANSRIFLSINTQAGSGPGVPYVSARTAGTSFSVKSTVVGDTSVVAYEIIEPG